MFGTACNDRLHPSLWGVTVPSSGLSFSMVYNGKVLTVRDSIQRSPVVWLSFVARPLIVFYCVPAAEADIRPPLVLYFYFSFLLCCLPASRVLCRNVPMG